jgi:hypothetical protein
VGLAEQVVLQPTRAARHARLGRTGGIVRKVLDMSAAATAAACALLVTGASPALAGGNSVNLTFDGSGTTLPDTGFESVYSIDPAGFAVGGGLLRMTTLPGDTFGNYENDPDSARNMFYSTIQPLAMTTVEARVQVQNLNVNFHGGGIWMGTDQDHYIRLGVFHNSFEGGVAVEALRENEDRWVNANPPGQGDDIVGRVIQGLQPSPQQTPIDAILRLVRTGSTVQAFISTNNGTTFQQVGGPGFTFTGFATPGDPQGNGSNTIEDLPGHPLGFKVGVYAFGGPDGQSPATFLFDSFSAESVPEPTSLGLLMLGGAMLGLRRRAR